jgi:outer membrane protein TolC
LQQKNLVASLDKQLQLAEQSTGQIRRRYLSGVENYQRVLSAQLSYHQLQRSRLSATRELIQYRIDLCRALAGSWRLEAPVSVSVGGASG